MITLSTSAADVLAELAEHGIDLQPLGGSIRFRPQHAMTPALLDRLQTHKAELLRLLDTEATIIELRRAIESLLEDSAWRSAWEERFLAGRYADFVSLRRGLDVVIGLAEEHHRRHDWKPFDSACKFLHRLASGEAWEKATPIEDPDRWKIWTDA